MRYWVLGAVLLSIAFASIGRITGFVFSGKLANVASKFGEGHLYREGGFIELALLEDLNSGEERPNCLQLQNWTLCCSSPSILGNAMRQSY